MLQPAGIPLFQSSPNLLLNLAVAVMLALVAGVFAALIIDNFDTRVRSRRDVTALDVPYLGGIPKVRDAKAWDVLQFTEQSPELRSILHRIAIDIFLYAADETPPFLLFTSPPRQVPARRRWPPTWPRPCRGRKSSDLHRRDVRGGRLAAQVGIPQTQGITDLISGRTELDESMFDAHWGGGFTVIPCGGSAIDVGEMLAGEKFRQLMRDLAGRFDVVIVDAPPITNLSDASLFTQNISNVVVVAEAAKKTRRAELQRVTRSLRHSGARILGVVLSRVRRDEQSAPADQEGQTND